MVEERVGNEVGEESVALRLVEGEGGGLMLTVYGGEVQSSWGGKIIMVVAVVVAVVGEMCRERGGGVGPIARGGGGRGLWRVDRESSSTRPSGSRVSTGV